METDLTKYKNKYIVYLLTFPNGKNYCGYSGNIKRRWHSSSQYKDCRYVYSAIQKYGWQNVKKEILFIFDNSQQALKKEKEEIERRDLLNPTKGYNLIQGGGKPPSGLQFVTPEGYKKMQENGKRLAKEIWENPEKAEYCKQKMRQGNQKWLKNSTVEDRKKRYGERNIGRIPHNAKPIYQLDLKTFQIINEYTSAGAAAKALGDFSYCKNIARTANGKGQTAYGFRWIWKENYKEGMTQNDYNVNRRLHS